MTIYVDIETGQTEMPVPPRIVLPFHHDEPMSWTEERVFTPDSPDWEDQLKRWAFLHGYMPQPNAR